MSNNSFQILIVEDDLSDIELTEIELNKLGMDLTIHSATSQKEFETFLDEYPLPDIVLCDYQLPGYNGKQALEKIRSIHPYLPFILITGFLKENEAIELMRNGASDIVMKDHIKRIGPATQRELINFRERVQTQKEIEKAHKRFKTLVENGSDILFILDENGNPTYASPTVEHVLGYTPEEITQKDMFDSVHPDDIDMMVDEIQKCLKKPGEPIKVPPARLQDKKGNWHWFDGTITNMLHDPAVGGIVDNFREITERLEAERNIVKAKEQYENLVQTIDGIVWEADAESFVFNYVSPQAKNILGYDPEEWIKKTDFWKSKIHPEEREKTVRYCHNQTQKGLNHTFEYRMQKANGEYIWIHDVITVVKKNGKPDSLRGLMIDINQEKELEEKLASAYDLAKIGSWELDLKKDKLYWSDYVKKIHEVEENYKPELETAINFYKDGWNREEITNAVNDAKENGSPFDLELTIETAKGNERWIRTVGEPEFSGNKCIRIFGTTQDITSRKKAEVELKKSNRLLAERVKEQRCLYEITNIEEQDLTIEELLSQAVKLIPPGMQYVDITAASITWQNQKFETDNFGPSPIKIAESNHRFGKNALQVEIQYTDTENDYDGKPFLEEEKSLLKAITNQVAQKIDQIIKRDEIREAEEKYRNVVEYSTNMFYQRDTEGILNYVSPQSIDFLGYTPEQAMRHWMDFITDHPLNKIGEKRTTKALETGEIQPPYDLQLKKRDGELIWVEVHEAPIKENGKVTGIAGSLSDITDRKKYEEELQESLERYNHVTKATRDAIYDWDIEKDNLHWGEGLKTLFGQKIEEEFPISKWAELVHPDDIEETQKNLEFTLKDHSMDHWVHEYRFRKGNGSYAHVLENGYIIRDSGGNAKRMIGAIRDVTESKQAEIQTALQQQVSQFFKNDNRLNLILDNLLHFLADYQKFNLAEIWLLSGDQTHLNLISKHARNKSAEKFYQKSKDIQKLPKGKGLVGITWVKNQIELWDNIDTNKKFVRNQAAKEAGMKSAFALPLYHNELPIGILLLASNDKASVIQHKIQDYKTIQEFLGAEIKRKQQEEEMMLLFESSPDILAVTTPDNHFVKVNPAFCKILGYSEEELTTHNFEHFIHPDDLDNTLKEYEETITGERQANNYINRWRTKSGEYRWISWSSSDVFGEDGYVFAFGRDVTDRTELERLLNQAQKIAKIGGWELNLVNNTVFWSSITKEIHEVAPDFEPDLETGINFYKEGESREKIRKVFQLAVDEGKAWDQELQIITAKGSEKWIRAKGEPEIIDGKCVRIYGSFQDINEKKKTAIELEEAYKEKETILESIDDGFFTLDKNWIVTYWNTQAERLFHTPKQEIVGENLWDVFDDAIDLPSYTNYHRVMHQKVTVSFEEYYAPIDKWFDINAYPSPEGISVFFKDITGRKIQDEHIKRINERFEKVTEATNDAIWDFNIEENHLFWSKGFQTLFGYDLDTINPNFEFLVSLIHPDDRERIAENIQEYMSDPDKTNWYEEYKFKKANGDFAFVIDRAKFIQNSRGNVIRVVGAMTDLTRQKEAEEVLRKLNMELEEQTKQLEASNAELKQFAYVASHDLQEPLRMVTSFLTQLEKKYGEKLDEKAREYIHFAVDGSKRMRQIILDLLNYSRLNHDHNNREKVDLKKILKDVQSLERSRIEETNAAISIQELPVIMANPGPIKQVFQNLLSNALKYHKPGGKPKIEIKAKELDTHWEISIKDNGIGINPEFQDTIFQIFQRLHTSDQYAGTGIGLAITKKIIERHGGEIWVDSEEGKGSIFYFTLAKYEND